MSEKNSDLGKKKEYYRLCAIDRRLNQKEYDRKRYLENRSDVLKRRKSRYSRNPEYQKLFSQKYYRENREAILRATKAYRLQHLDRIRERANIYRNSILGRLTEYRERSRNKNIEFFLSEIEFSELLNGKCHYCDEEKAMGIDRKDCKRGYTKENSVSCCKVCNYMKREHSYDFFLNHIKKIVDNRL